MIEGILASILRLFSWFAFAGVERRMNLAPDGILPVTGHLFCYELPALRHFADENDHPRRSSLRLTEDGQSLRLAHCLHVQIVAKGGGRYSHYNGRLYFSTSDNSDPRTNGRAYAISYVVTFRSIGSWLSAEIQRLRWVDISKFLHFRVTLSRACLSAWVRIKWLHDRRHLPLTPGHRDLYDTIHGFCWRRLGQFPNLINCRDYNDKIQWLKLFDQGPEKIECSDKVAVRNYIRSRVGEEHIVKLYQTRDHFSEIDFCALPKSFVIKANNDSGTVILVPDKSKLDLSAAEKRVESALGRRYGRSKGEWAYAHIVPKVLVEEFIGSPDRGPPPDYKFYCSEGVVRVCRIIVGRGGADLTEQAVDSEGADLSLQMHPSLTLVADFRRPAIWSEMKRVAQELSRGHKFVRVDLYCVDDRVYVGEMTFWPGAGAYLMPDQRVLGEYLIFDRATYRPMIRPFTRES